jgi:hypothetical protein
MTHDFSTFILLWSARNDLDVAGWESLYRMTHQYLASCPARSFEPGLDDRKTLIDDFFHDKIFMSAGAGGQAPFGAGALCKYFRNYLVDRTRNAWDAHRISADDAGTAYESCGCETEEDTDQVLAQIGLAVEKVAETAKTFLQALDESDRVYLALHTCADEAEALSALARRFRIASYHHRAKRLGITREKGEFDAGYEKTRIGTWLNQTLGIDLSAGHRKEILAAIKILCVVSLAQWEAVSS